MLVTVQFPIADARGFEPDADLHLDLPDWDDLTTDIFPQFVHHFGRAVKRHRKLDVALPNEAKFCQASRALRLPDLSRCAVGSKAKPFRPACAFRRLFCDAHAVVRVEVGFVHDARAPQLKDLTGPDLLAIVKDLCELPTRVPKVGAAPSDRRLLEQGLALAKLYADGTLGRAALAKADKAAKLVEAGSPLVLVELNPGEAAFPCVPEGFTAADVTKPAGMSAAFARFRTRAGIVGTWIVQRGSAKAEDARSLRLCLTRLHAEQEVLDVVLKQLTRRRLLNPCTDQALDDLEDYFNRRTKLINQSERQGVDQSAILAAVDAVVGQVAEPAERENLAERYQGARRQVWAKIKEYELRREADGKRSIVYLEKGASYVKDVTINQSGTGNVANIGKFMASVTNNVTNNLAQSQADEQVKALVKQLSDQVAALPPEANPQATMKLGKNLEALSKEAAEPEPDKAWYKVSLEGLKSAAEAVGEVAVPILGTVAKLAALLLT